MRANRIGAVIGAVACIGLGVAVVPALADDGDSGPARTQPDGTIIPEPEDTFPPRTKADIEALVNPDNSPNTWVCGPDADGNFTVVMAYPADPNAKPDPNAGPVVELPQELKDCPRPGS
jgi:hypothetical protein